MPDRDRDQDPKNASAKADGFDEAETSFLPEAASVRAARRFILSLEWTDDEDTRNRLATLISELASNAVLHARTPYVLNARLSNQRIRVSITDTGHGQPVIRHHGPSAPTGRGLRIVEAMADRWGVQSNPSGKTVWFEVDRQRRSA